MPIAAPTTAPPQTPVVPERPTKPAVPPAPMPAPDPRKNPLQPGPGIQPEPKDMGSALSKQEQVKLVKDRERAGVYSRNSIKWPAKEYPHEHHG